MVTIKTIEDAKALIHNGILATGYKILDANLEGEINIIKDLELYEVSIIDEKFKKLYFSNIKNKKN